MLQVPTPAVEASTPLGSSLFSMVLFRFLAGTCDENEVEEDASHVISLA
jgi:hypothetical protein